MTLTRTRIQAGVWEGVLTAPEGAAPQIAASHLDRALPPPEVSAVEGEPGAYRVRLAIPPELLADGVQTVLFSDAASGATLDSFTIVTGEPLEDDIRAELDLLRAELDMLKKAFRRHCVETA